MKPFQYRLQFLHHSREKLQDNAKEAYAKAMQSRIRQEKRSQDILDRISQVATQIQEQVDKGIHPRYMPSFYGAMANFKEEFRRSQELVAEKAKEEEKLRLEYLSKKSEFDALDKHRERKKGEHLFHQFKEEEKMLEDIANNRPALHTPFSSKSLILQGQPTPVQ